MSTRLWYIWYETISPPDPEGAGDRKTRRAGETRMLVSGHGDVHFRQLGQDYPVLERSNGHGAVYTPTPGEGLCDGRELSRNGGGHGRAETAGLRSEQHTEQPEAHSRRRDSVENADKVSESISRQDG